MTKAEILRHIHDLAECAKHEDAELAAARVERIAYWATEYTEAPES